MSTPTARDLERAKVLWSAIERHCQAPDSGSHNWHFYMVNDLIAPYLAAERERILAEVLPVLEFYADGDCWELSEVINEEDTEMSSIENDSGKRARALLTKLKGEK